MDHTNVRTTARLEGAMPAAVGQVLTPVLQDLGPFGLGMAPSDTIEDVREAFEDSKNRRRIGG